MEALTLVNKWIHLTSMASLVGMLAASYFIIGPVLRAAGLAESDQARTMRKRLGMSVGVLWLVVFLTGFINTYLVWPRTTEAYHHELLGKFVLAVLMFGLTMASSGHGRAGASGERPRRGALMGATLLLALLVLGASAHLNIMRVTGKGIVPVAAPTR